MAAEDEPSRAAAAVKSAPFMVNANVYDCIDDSSRWQLRRMVDVDVERTGINCVAMTIERCPHAAA